jgi:hypothetical protein
MQKMVSGILGAAVAALAVAYVVDKDKRLMGRLDTEKSLTIARIPIALSLLWASVAGDKKSARRTLSSVGLSYIGMGIGSLFDKRLGGALKNGFTKSDTIFHLASGLGALAVSLVPDKKKPAHIPVTTQ